MDIPRQSPTQVLDRIVVTGSGGQLGSEICRQLGRRAIPVDRDTVDMRDADAVARFMRDVAPQAIINTAGFTDVDGAERHPEACWAINSEAVRALANVCRELDCQLVQVSTDYVFSAHPHRSVPYTEDELTAATGVYARSKEAAERHAALAPRRFVVRTCGLYGLQGPRTAKPNFVDAILHRALTTDRLRVVCDQYCSPSYVPDVAAAILFLTTTTAYGTYHVVNGGGTSWFEFAAEILRQAKIRTPLEAIASDAWPAAAPRPRYSVLDTRKYHALGGPVLPPWNEALSRHLMTVGVQQ